MFARLNRAFWTTTDDRGNRTPIVLSDVYRYAGMASGKAVHDGRLWARPLVEFEALSLDGIEWKPMRQLLLQIPWEKNVQDH